MAKYTLLKNKVTGERSVRNNKTNEVITEKDNPKEYKALRAKALNNLKAREYNSIMKDMGLTRVVGEVSGKVYWE